MKERQDLLAYFSIRAQSLSGHHRTTTIRRWKPGDSLGHLMFNELKCLYQSRDILAAPHIDYLCKTMVKPATLL